jgi:tetrahydromethanopterin S-methyltransferase subunit G
MEPRRSRPRGGAVHPAAIVSGLPILVLLAVLLAACGAGSAPQAGATVAGEPAASADGGNGEPAGGGAGQGDGVPFADLVDRKIIKTGEVTLEVPRVGAAIGEVRAMAASLRGYVAGSRAGSSDETATLELRVPADAFDEALERLHDMEGEVRVEATNEEDVTSSVVDLEARIRNLEASERQYRVLVERAQDVDDILAVQSRLDQVRGEIEQLTAQLQQLSDLAALSTLTVTLVPAVVPVQVVAEGWDPGVTFGKALAALVGAGQGLADLAIWIGVVVLPTLLAGALLLWLALRITPIVRRRVPPAPVADD